MGYDLHITRKTDWADKSGASITADEWLALVRDDPELMHEERNGPHYVVWSGPSVHAEPWLDFASGVIFTTYPDRPLIQKMVRIARRLNAEVQGDDGELYREDGSSYDAYVPPNIRE